MMKQVVLFVCDENQNTHYPAMIFEASYADLCRLEPDFKNSSGLPLLFSEPSIAVVFILLFTRKGNSQVQRRLAAMPGQKNLSDQEIKDFMIQLTSDLEVNLTFHSRNEFRKIIPHKKEDRDLLSRLMKATSPKDWK